MPKYIALEKCFVNNTIHEEGATLEYSGPPCHYLQPVDPVEEAPAEVVAEAPRKWTPRKRGTTAAEA